MPADLPELELWSHEQTEHPERFAEAGKRLESMIRLAEKYSSGRSLLNIGCGDGYLERAAQRSRWKVVSVDPDPTSVAGLKSEGIDARRGCIEALPVDPESMDVVVCSEVLEHLTSESLEVGLREVRRVLVPGGLLLGTVPYREDLSQNEVYCPHCKRTFHRWGHHQAFDEAALASRLGQYFRVRQVRPAYFPAWDKLNWKGTILWALRVASAGFGVFGADAKLVFVAAKGS